MSKIKPFTALRPKPGYADAVASPPFDVLTSDEAREMAKGNPYSFLRVVKPEIDLDPSIGVYDDRVYAMASRNLNELARSVMIRDKKPCLYIYRLTMGGAEQTGLVACGCVDEYLSGKIKKHELTREDKEMDRTRHIEATNANTEPIFLAYRHSDNPGIRERLKASTLNSEPAYDFIAMDGIRHQVWIVGGADEIDGYVRDFQQLPSMYIADGHHRSASAANVAMKRRECGYDPDAEFNFTLYTIFPDIELSIMDYNRVVKDLNGLSSSEFLAKVSRLYAVSASDAPVKPKKPHEFGLYLDRKWYRLALVEDDRISAAPISSLDVSVLQETILTPILGIGDPRSDKRIDFVGGVRGLGELEKRVGSGEMAVAFSLFPTSMGQLMSVADAGEVMPPKSTWFEPKLRSGLFVHMLG